MPQARISSQMAGPWWQLTWRERVLGAAMLPLFGQHNRISMAIETLPEFVCHQLGVDGADRAGVRQSLRKIYAAGLIVRDGEYVRLLYSESALKKYRSPQGPLRGPSGVPASPDHTQASGIRALTSRTWDPSGVPARPNHGPGVEYLEALQKGIRDEHRARGIAPTPRLKPWEYDGGTERVRELVESGRCPDPYTAARLLAEATLTWTGGAEPFGPALLQVQLPSLGIINLQPRDQIV